MKLETTSVKREIWVESSIEKVWKAHIDPEQRKQWDAWNADIDFRIGGKVFIQHGWGAVTSSVITEIVEYEKLVFSSEDGDFQNITSFVPENDGVRVTVEYRMSWGGVDESLKENMAFGTFRFMQNLKSVLEAGVDLRPTFWRTSLGIKHTTHHGNHTQGTVVLQITPDSPAMESGLLPRDVITEVDEQPIRTYEELEMFLQKRVAGDAVTLGVFRDGQKIYLKCELASYSRLYKE